MKENEYLNRRQMSVYKTNKVLLELNSKLAVAHDSAIAVHRKNEKNDKGEKLRDSMIGIVAIDFSKDESVRVEENLYPSQLRLLYEAAKEKKDNYHYEFNGQKVFGEEDENGLCTARKLSINHQYKMPNGDEKKYPWSIRIENGKGKKKANANGSYYLDNASYQCEKVVSVSMTDRDFFVLLDEAITILQTWENSYGVIHMRRYMEYLKKHEIDDDCIIKDHHNQDENTQ